MDVIVEKNEVVFLHKESVDLNAVKEKLKGLGYPESGTTEGFEKFTRNVKSYLSCAIGKLDNQEETKTSN